MAEHQAAARSVAVGVPGVMLRAVVLLVKWQGAPARRSSPMGIHSTGWQTLRRSWVVLCILEAVLLGAVVVVVLGSMMGRRVVVGAKCVEVLKRVWG